MQTLADFGNAATCQIGSKTAGLRIQRGSLLDQALSGTGWDLRALQWASYERGTGEQGTMWHRRRSENSRSHCRRQDGGEEKNRALYWHV